MKRLAAALGVAMFVAVLGAGGLLASGLTGYRAFVIRTGSMTPTIPPMSLVVVRTGEYAVGQVASFRKGDTVVSHRVVERRPDGSLTTKGDANATADALPVPVSDVIGEVVAHEDRVGFWVVYLRNPLTLASLAVLAIGLWAVWPLFFGADPAGRPAPAAAA